MGTRFQALFHSPLGVLFTFPSRYWFTIGHRRVFSLGGRSPQLQTAFLVYGLTRDNKPTDHITSHTGLSPCVAGLSRPFCCDVIFLLWLRFRALRSCFPQHPCSKASELIRVHGFGLCPGSLATTTGISVDFFSSGYLDVSVPPVVPSSLCVQLEVTGHNPC